mmetsp:Transcript_194/g.429  ORF Transcript_194/g.429 Transcript_194/m.429 type:complete len:309 (+) Transcript_194:319-1245(+)
MAFDLRTECPAWGMPSLNPGDTAALVLLRFNGIPVHVISTAQLNPSVSPVDTCVILKEDIEEGLPSLSGFGDVYGTLKLRNLGADFRLTRAQKAEARAFCSMIASKLGSGSLAEAWAIEDNFFSGTAQAYAAELPLVLRPFIPKLRRSFVRKHMPSNRTEEDIISDAEECIAALESRIGSRSSFFYGTEPTALDALSFAYTLFVMLAPCPRLRGALRKAPNLVQHTARVSESYFPSSAFSVPDMAELEGAQPRNATQTKSETKTSSDTRLSPAEALRREWNRYFLGACAASFVGYLLIYAGEVLDLGE